MKLLPYAILAALLLSIASCRRDNAALERMRHAEAIMHTAPDSALAIIRSIPDSTLHSAEARALHALLLTQALDKNYLDLPDETLLYKVVEYYNQTSDKHHRMLAYFYLGRRNYYVSNYNVATPALHTAEKYAKELHDTFILSQIYGDLGGIYGNLFSARMELKYAMLEYETLKDWNHPDYLAWAQSELTRAYLNCRQPLKSDSICDLLMNQPELLESDYELLNTTLTTKSRCKLSLKEYAECDSLLDSLSNLTDGNYTIVDANNHIVVSYALDKFSKGDSLIKKHLIPQNKPIPSYVYAYKNDYRNAHKSLRAEYDSIWNYLTKALSQDASLAAEEFHLGVIKDEKDHSSNILTVSLTVISVLIVLAVIAYLIASRKMEREKRISAEICLDVKILKEEIESLAKYNQSLSQNIYKLFGEKFDFIDKLSNDYYEYRGLKSEKAKLSDSVNKILKSFKEQNTVSNLVIVIDRYFNGLASDFKADFPQLPEIDYKLFLFLICGFSIKSIALFLDKSNDVLYNHKSRMKAKISASDCPRKKEYLRFFSPST